MLSSGEWLPGAIEFFLPKDIKTTVKVIHDGHLDEHLKDLVRLFSGFTHKRRNLSGCSASPITNLGFRLKAKGTK